MRVSIPPKTMFGWWSICLCIAGILFLVLAEVILGPGPDYDMPLAYALTSLLTSIGVAAFVTGLIGV